VTYDTLLNDRAKLVEVMRAISDGAEADGRSELNEAENTAFEAKKKELASLNAAIEVEETIRQAELSLSPRLGDSQPLPGDQDDKQDEPAGFNTFGDMLQAVAVASKTQGANVDPRLIGPQAATGLSEGVTSDGGFLVNTDVASGLLTNVYETGILTGRVARTPISANANGLKLNGIDETSRASGSQWGGITSYWLNEGGTLTGSKPKFRQVELNLKKLIGLCYATDELLSDAAALESVITTGFANVFGFKMDESIVRGTGAGQPLGILNSACKVTVSAEGGQAATTIVSENVEKMYARMHPRGLGNAVWLVNQDCWPELFNMYHSVGTGGSTTFLPPGGLSASPYHTLLGRPVIPCEQCSTLGTEGDIIFADLSQYMMIDKGGVQTASSIHVQFTTDESVFRFVVRVDGQPTWASAVTPAQGSNTVSPFITLATRS